MGLEESRHRIECHGEQSGRDKTEEYDIDMNRPDSPENEPTHILNQIRCHQFGGAQQTRQCADHHPNSRRETKAFHGQVVM